ncbi:MAG: PilZ domain-containing protein [Lachnospiraceae bacterium]|nr:PilZ domain-containing protein [Lachnospiraceae bacterium]
MQERRKSNRMKIDVKIKLDPMKNGAADVSRLNKEEFTVELVDISKDGLAFKTTEKLELNTYYDTMVVLWTKEKFETVIEIVRMENYGDGPTLYGCRFIGIMPSDQLKIQIYEMVSENEKQE